MLPGIYADARLPDSLDLRIAAVAMVLPTGVAVARRTAAWVFGVDALDPRGHPEVPKVESVALDQVRRPRHRLSHPHSADDLQAEDVVVIGDVRLTSPLRTACDLGRFLPRPQALAAIDAMLHAGLVSQDEMGDQVDRWRRRRGVRQLAEMIHLSEPACESAGESRMRLRVVDAGLPRPQVQIPVLDHSGYGRYRLDAGYAERRVGFEFDGEEYHPPERAAADEARREWITGRGWRLAVFRRDDVYRTTRVVELTVRRLLGDR